MKAHCKPIQPTLANIYKLIQCVGEIAAAIVFVLILMCLGGKIRIKFSIQFQLLLQTVFTQKIP